jgi:predicted component of type VI protein secretion system
MSTRRVERLAQLLRCREVLTDLVSLRGGEQMNVEVLGQRLSEPMDSDSAAAMRRGRDVRRKQCNVRQ